jgi:vacuolar-type H+-ATPase subunit H
MSLERLNEITKKGKETLNKIIKGKVSGLDHSIRELQEIVCAAAERARRLSNWDIKQIEAEAEKSFDDTIAAIEAYLDFVKDDGEVHEASKRIRAAAMEKERVFREKAEAKNSSRYKELANAMHTQAEKASAAWEAIRKERKNAEDGLKNLREYRELYIDVKSAQGIGEAVKELEAVRDDLIKLSQTMRKVQEAVLQEAKKTAEELSDKPSPSK